MIRRGRAEGWLKAPIATAFRPWAEFNGVAFDGVKVGSMLGFEHRGSTVIAERTLSGGAKAPLLCVPRDLIVSLESIGLHAKSDQFLREVLDVIGEFGRTTRGAVLVFLLLQATICCPDVEGIGVINPLTEYVKFLPDELLPTFWTEEEQELLEGTTLRPAVRAKLNSLLREFELLRTTTGQIPWCAKHWWDEQDGLVTFEDWMQVDAMYRSRALEFPGIGDAMVPCVDMANHASGDATAALYETDPSGNALLLLRDGKEYKQDEEITITYGDEKGACEMIFSYGFIEDSVTSAKVMFLDLEIPIDDPLRPAKLAVSTVAPGFRIFEKTEQTDWDSDFIWLVCINEEDGLEFKIARTNDGETELKTLWKDKELDDTSKLKDFLQVEPLWDVYQLRAVVLLQGRVKEQLQALQVTEFPTRDSGIRETPWQLARRLRKLERGLLEKAYEDLEDQKSALVQLETVRHYLGLVDEDGVEEDYT